VKKFLAFLLIVSASLGFIYFKSKRKEKIVPVKTATVKRGKIKKNSGTHLRNRDHSKEK